MTTRQKSEQGIKAGAARNAALSPERRREIASLGGKAKRGYEGKATNQGVLKIGTKVLECHVLDDGRRLLTQTAFFEALGRTQRGTLAKDRKLLHNSEKILGAPDPLGGVGGKPSVSAALANISISQPPPFLDAENLKAFVPEEVRVRYSPVRFLTLKGNVAVGYEATLLPEVVEVYLKARDAGILRGRQAELAKVCETVGRVLMKVGIIALVDEATGYQYDRARDALQLLLKTYISADLLPATSRFPHEYLQGAYRLCGWEYSEGVAIKPHLLGTFINRTLYDKLPDVVIAQIRELNPVREATKRRKHRQWQFLTETTGIPHLDRLFSAAILLMRVFETREEFYRAYDKAVPTPLRLLGVASSSDD